MLTIATDGSATSDSNGAVAGWGFTVADPMLPLCLDFYGPVITVPTHAHYLGATVCTNNTGELSGFINACNWAANFCPGRICQLLYDSTYAFGIASGGQRPKTNFRLAITARDCYRRLMATTTTTFRHIDSHTGDTLNERADRLAAVGAQFRTNWLFGHTPSSMEV